MKQEQEVGYFVFSFDTELAWGYFDKDVARARLFSGDGQREHSAIRRVLALCEEYDIGATWALVGHLLHPKCEACAVCPVLDWKGKYSSFESIYETDHPLWYAPEIVNLLIAHSDKHEIAFHGYTHRMFPQMDGRQAQYEIDVWTKLVKAHHFECKSVIFPRNKVAYLDRFRESGFQAFRGEDPYYLPLQVFWVGKLVKALDHLLSISTPPTYYIDQLPVVNGLLNVRASAHLFDFNRRLELVLDECGLHRRRLHRVVRAINEAAARHKLVHIWAHPWEFRTEKDFSKLEYILESAAKHVSQGHLQSARMRDIINLVQQRPGQ